MTGAAVGAGTVAAPAIAQSMPKLNWRLTSAYPASLDTLFGSAKTVADYVSAATDGNFSIEVFPGGDIAPPLEAVDAVTAGTVEMAHTATSFYWERDPTWAVASALSFGLNDRQQNAWFYYGNGNTLVNAFLAGEGLYGLPCGNTGTQMGGWFRREINTLDDYQGLKFRMPGLGG
ncbi:MAG TPA: ABC transporter substrate-binding protein, partial [Kiloniellaceae bacterium]|nr:ABC transporter substrate-binding protein [Kiloniellaceae bacterium]